ncbi:hypothetical protein M231_03032 [Tremella mesenterica]|uniref:Uncharacterized protein n=1 Tax=Tremella mesenterica TaxID=5217 RepID=A0A4Q1BP72_TREME|nr:hypothetical protein M231_03032 [Tremella mesenterica]
MSTISVFDPAIDPALRTPPRTRRRSSVTTRSTTGNVKRKSRGPQDIPPGGAGTKGIMNRRTGSFVGVDQEGVEPTRGEEENLNRYDYSTAKRTRHNPPVKVVNDQRFDPALDMSTWYGPSALPAIPIVSTMSNDPLPDPVLTESNSPKQPIPTHRLPYPYGMTPFRYPCLTPHLPPPPPGDPSDPSFRRFDPYEPRQVDSPGQPQIADQLAHPVQTQVHGTQHTQTGVGVNVEAERGQSEMQFGDGFPLGMEGQDADAYASISALLSASAAFEGQAE